jgi:hypothetical protein
MEIAQIYNLELQYSSQTFHKIFQIPAYLKWAAKLYKKVKSEARGD